ncbi:MAG: TetR/AcrR family transcriptional regulator [Labilithrix sp.]|nr:TetR/AcrR family transcriptional regulator [Labilithrix sp.]MCW5811552.1 TetR/AcrR family transcriptional regulator [Labilithrix sp.]
MPPKLWSATIDEHRHDVTAAILDATAVLAHELGIRKVTMSLVAERAGIGRATLYKYFPDVESILLAWHEREVSHHVEQLAKLRDSDSDVFERLRAVFERVAQGRRDHGGDLAAMLHRGAHMHRAHDAVRTLIRDLLVSGIGSGRIRSDVPPDELASFCVHALSAANGVPSKGAVRRLITVTLDALRTHGA